MAKDFNPGNLRYRITFLSPPTDKDEFGERVEEWTPYKTVWASKEPIIGKELYAALTADTKVDVKYRTRYTAGVTNDMRVRHGEELYDIISAVDPFAGRRELVCYCRLVWQ